MKKDKFDFENLPNELPNDIINILAEMSMELPVSKEWVNIAKKLSSYQRIAINNRISQIQKEQEIAKLKSMSDEQKLSEELKWKKMLSNNDPYQFYGNMGQPVTIQDFKNRYGAWPPGYDENIDPNRLPDILTEEQIEKIAQIYIEYKAPQYWAEICSSLIFKKTNQLQRVFDRVYEIKGKKFPFNGNPLRQLTIYEFKEMYGIWPPGGEL